MTILTQGKDIGSGFGYWFQQSVNEWDDTGGRVVYRTCDDKVEK